MCGRRLRSKLSSMNSNRIATSLDRLPRLVRAGLLAGSIAAAFAIAGTGAQASPIKDAPTGPTVDFDPAPAPFVFKSATADRFLCSVDGSDYALCEPPSAVTAVPGPHVLLVRAIDRDGVVGPPAERDWFNEPIATPTPGPFPTPAPSPIATPTPGPFPTPAPSPI